MNKTFHTSLINTFVIVLLFSLTHTTAAQITPKIIGGKVSDPNEWPWMAGVVTKGKSDFEGQFCGGTLIDKNWVLTAAHCVNDNDKNNLDVIINRAEFDTSSGERIKVKQIITHPRYNDITLDNDIALIKLHQPSNVQPIDIIETDSNLDNAGMDSLALGWGTTSAFEDFYPTVLFQVELPIVANIRCSSVLSGYTDNMLCAGAGLGSRDTCKGDSGGPLIVFNDKTNAWHQVGITSWGNGCAQRGFSGVYTRLKNYNDFISNTICSLEETPKPVSMTLTVNANIATASWQRSDNATGYRLYFAPFPQAQPIQYIDVGDITRFFAELEIGNAFFVAIVSYNNRCLSDFSNIEHFIIK